MHCYAPPQLQRSWRENWFGTVPLSIYLPLPSPAPSHPLTPPPPPSSTPPHKKKCFLFFFRSGFFVKKNRRLVGWRSRSGWRENDKMVINWACQGHNLHNLYINALLCPRLRRSWRGKLVLGLFVCPSIYPVHTPTLRPTRPPPPHPTPTPKKNFFVFYFNFDP